MQYQKSWQKCWVLKRLNSSWRYWMLEGVSRPKYVLQAERVGHAIVFMMPQLSDYLARDQQQSLEHNEPTRSVPSRSNGKPHLTRISERKSGSPDILGGLNLQASRQRIEETLAANAARPLFTGTAVSETNSRIGTHRLIRFTSKTHRKYCLMFIRRHLWYKEMCFLTSAANLSFP